MFYKGNYKIINPCNKFILCKKSEKDVKIFDSIIIANLEKVYIYKVESWAEDCTLKLNVGNELVFNKYSEQEIDFNGNTLYAIKEESVLAVISFDN